ncbi:uncharacterized protein [Littorina saxatilis]|uniref:Apple domain-containing protein n=1 Tax=Littorina saxatilis TaxID=31220 RepID=A0AAN9C3M1_9CAEN
MSKGKRTCRGHSSSTVSRSPSRVPSPGTRLYILRTTTPAIVQNTSTDSTVATTVTEDQPVFTSTVATTTTSSATTTTVTNTTQGWLQKACTTDPECPETNSRCFSGKCLCTPGYYFYKSTKTCVSTCSLGNLLQEVVEYPMWYIFGHNNGGASANTYNACLSACLGDVNCRSFDYRHNGDICSTSYKDALDVPPGDWRPSTTADQLYYYQRVCA